MREVIEQNKEAARISNAEIRMLFGKLVKRGHNRRKHQKKYNHANRRVGAKDRREECK